MHSSIRDLRWLKINKFLFPTLLLVGTLISTIGLILGLKVDDPLTWGDHAALAIGGILVIFIGFFLNLPEDDFAQKYDMTHLLDIDDKQQRFEAYLEHLSDWIASDMENVNPVRTRGVDPSGPDWGKTDFVMGQEPARRDAIVEGDKYTGMEGELTSTEKMVEKANQKYATYAQERWERSESEDPDLIEYGVERLGDLVRTDYFDKNAEEGVFEKVANPNEEGH